MTIPTASFAPCWSLMEITRSIQHQTLKQVIAYSNKTSSTETYILTTTWRLCWWPCRHSAEAIGFSAALSPIDSTSRGELDRRVAGTLHHWLQSMEQQPRSANTAASGLMQQALNLKRRTAYRTLAAASCQGSCLWDDEVSQLFMAEDIIMKAAIMRNAEIVVDDMAMPKPSEGEVLVKTLACGICGSDLHALKHGHDMVQTSIETGGSFVMDLTKDVVMGHEFCAEVLDYGPGTTGTLKPGTRVCSFPTTVHNGRSAPWAIPTRSPAATAKIWCLPSLCCCLCLTGWLRPTPLSRNPWPLACMRCAWPTWINLKSR